MIYKDLYHTGARKLSEDDQEALYLLNELCRLSGIELYSNMDEPAEAEIEKQFLEGIELLRQNRPLAYILKSQPFYGYDFYVDENCFIPRPETEELCELVLELSDSYFKDEVVTVFDVATGSGAIAITLSLEADNFDVFADDLSDKALEIARKNNKDLGGHVIFLQGDLLEPFIDRDMKCSILVCNPPYIKEDEILDASVKDYEPALALFGGKDGLAAYRKIFEKAHLVLKEKYLCAFEIGWDQKEDLIGLAKEYFPEAHIQVYPDLSGKDRMLVITNCQDLEKEKSRE